MARTRGITDLVRRAHAEPDEGRRIALDTRLGRARQPHVVVHPLQVFRKPPVGPGGSIRLRRAACSAACDNAAQALGEMVRLFPRRQPGQPPAPAQRPRPALSRCAVPAGKRLQPLRHLHQHIAMIAPVIRASAIARRLQLEHLRVAPAESHQLLVAAFLGNLPACQHHDAVGHAHRRKPMRDEQAPSCRRSVRRSARRPQTRCARRAPPLARPGSATAHRAGRRAPSASFCHSPPERSTPVSKRRPSI